MGIKSTVAESWTRDLIYVTFCLILHKMHIVGTLKNRLGERDDSFEHQQLASYTGEREIIETVCKKVCLSRVLLSCHH